MIPMITHNVIKKIQPNVQNSEVVAPPSATSEAAETFCREPAIEGQKLKNKACLSTEPNKIYF